MTIAGTAETTGPDGGPARIAFAPGMSGEIVPWELRGDELLLQRGAFLASTEGIRCESRSEGLKGLFAQGLFVLRATGTGTIFGDAENFSTACSMSTRLCIVV